MIQIELTQQEVELLFEALETWEQAPMRQGLTTAMLSAMLTKEQEGKEQAYDKTMAESRQEELRRKRQSIMLKAKLIQSLEHLTANGLFNTVVEDTECNPED